MQQEHGPPLMEMAPFLTSFHEDEAEKTGLLGNTMSLYEKFTVLPHRFAQLSGACTPSSAPISCSEQSLSREYHHLSPLSRMPSLPTSSRAQSFTCKFFGTSDGTTVCKNIPMDGPGQPMATQDALFDSEAMVATEGNLTCTALKTTDEFLFPEPSNHTSDNKTRDTSLMFGICDSPPADVMKLVEGAQYLSLGDGLGNVSKLNQEGCTCVGRKAVMTDKEPLKVLKWDRDTSYQEQGKDAMIILSSESCPQQLGSFERQNISQLKRSNTEGAQFDKPVTNDVEVSGQCCSDEGRMDTRENELNHLKESPDDARNTCDNIESGSGLLGTEEEVPKKTEDSISLILDIVGANTDRITNQLPHFPVRDQCGAFGESANGSSCKYGIAESSQHDIAVGDHSDHSESACAPLVSPTSVIQAMGQLRFWKARLALIRPVDGA